MQLNEPRRHDLRKCYINVRKIDKNTYPPKGMRSGKQLFFPYPSVFAESYVRCVVDNMLIQTFIKGYLAYNEKKRFQFYYMCNAIFRLQILSMLPVT